MSEPREVRRDRDPDGRARNARVRDDLGRPLPRTAGAAAPVDEPARPPAQALMRAQELLDAGAPFAAHEVLEAVWKTTLGPNRELWRGLAQIAVGITHALRDNPSGATTLLRRGVETLAPFAASTPYEVDVNAIRAWATRATADLSLTTQPPRLTVDQP